MEPEIKEDVIFERRIENVIKNVGKTEEEKPRVSYFSDQVSETPNSEKEERPKIVSINSRTSRISNRVPNKASNIESNINSNIASNITSNNESVKPKVSFNEQVKENEVQEEKIIQHVVILDKTGKSGKIVEQVVNSKNEIETERFTVVNENVQNMFDQMVETIDKKDLGVVRKCYSRTKNSRISKVNGTNESS